MDFRKLTDFYHFEVGSYGTSYVVFLVLTVQFSIMALLLDATRIPMSLFGIQLSALFLSLGMTFFVSDMTLGIVEKSYRARTRGGFMMVVLESARTTSYGVLPFMWFAMSVLLYFGGPSDSFFPFLKMAMFLFVFLAALPSFVKTLTFQIPLLFGTVWDRPSHRFVLAASTVAITIFGVYSYFASVYMLPTIFLTWFMYMAFMMFLEVVLLFILAENLINFRRDVFILAVTLYLLVLTYSALGVMETSKLTIETYGEVLPKALTGLALIIVNVKLTDLRLLSSIAAEGRREGQVASLEPPSELKDLLQKLYQEAVENRKSVQRQQRAVLELYSLMNTWKPAVASRSGDIQQELERIRTYIERTSAELSNRLAEAMKLAAMEAAKQARCNPREIVAYILGPRIEGGTLTRRNKMVEELSPFIPIVLAFVAQQEMSSGTHQRTIKRTSLADFLRQSYPPFRSIWSRRTVQDFTKGLIDNYLLSYKEAFAFFRAVGQEIEILENDVNKALLDVYKDEFARTRGEVDFVLLLHELRKAKRVMREEFGLSDEEILLYKEKRS